MLMVENKRKQPKRDRTLFRRTLNKLMVKRDIFYWKDLRVELENVGYEIGQSGLSQYLNGQRDPEELEELFAAIDRALHLSKEEKMLLAYTYAYPDNAGRPQSAQESNTERLPGGAKSSQDLREGLEAASDLRRAQNSEEGDEREAGADRRA